MKSSLTDIQGVNPWIDGAKPMTARHFTWLERRSPLFAHSKAIQHIECRRVPCKSPVNTQGLSPVARSLIFRSVSLLHFKIHPSPPLIDNLRPAPPDFAIPTTVTRFHFPQQHGSTLLEPRYSSAPYQIVHLARFRSLYRRYSVQSKTTLWSPVHRSTETLARRVMHMVLPSETKRKENRVVSSN